MKTLGILEADTLYPDLLNDYQSYGQLFVRLFERLGYTFNYRFYQVQEGELPAPYDCDAYLLTGSKAGVYDNLPWQPPLQQWLQQAFARQEKLLGICFGHQMLAQALGGYAAKSVKGWGIGLHTTVLECVPCWLPQPVDQQQLTLIYSHQDQVERLPTGAQRMASSEFCENAAFVIGRQVLAFQGHPEITPEYLKRLLPRRAAHIGAELLQQKLSELSQPKDADLIGQWLAEFVLQDG